MALEYERLWAIVEAHTLVTQPFLLSSYSWVVVPFLVVAVVDPRYAKVAMIARLVSQLLRAPFIFENCWWALLTDLSVLFDAPEAMRWQMALFYAACGFWKLNSAFFDLKVSCAPIFIMQLASAYWEPLKHLATWSPELVAYGEILIGIALVLWPRVGNLLAIALHAGIGLVGTPNQIVPFGVFCLSRLAYSTPLGVPGPFAFALAASMASLNTTGDPRGALALAVFAILASAMLLGEKKPTRGSCRWYALIPTLFYVGLVHPLGLMDIAAASPFATIRMHGGSNHWLVPTNIFRVGGPVVRVEACNSTYINNIFPADATDLLTPRTRALLRDFGHVAREFAATPGRVGLPKVPGAPFVPYTIPLMELRRLVAEARTVGDRFAITYVRDSGDVVRLDVATESTSCELLGNNDGVPCEPPPALPWYLRKFGPLFFPLPILDGVSNIPCID